ncbi:MAG: GerMN domain-containing protein [Spirochaetales bacterium]|nr:GerMN domain-containing protein [Spirochaetales bacterium]
MTPKTRRILWGPSLPLALLVVAFLISSLSLLIFGPDVDGRIFYFPSNSGERVGTERRWVPSASSYEKSIVLFLEELVLGPEALEWAPLLPRESEVRSVFLLNDTVCVDFKSNVLKNENTGVPVDFNKALAILEKNILDNFRRVEEVIFTIEGQQVHAPYFRAEVL